MSNNEVEIIVKSTDKTAQGFQSAKREASGFGDSLKRVGETAAGFFAANVVEKGLETFKNFVSGSVEAASNLGESINAVQKVFGDSQQKILDWGKSNAVSFGLSQRAFNELATPLGALLKNSGISMDKVSDSTINLTKRAADMASVFNTSVPDALDAIQAGLRGESDPLERYGVSLTAAKVQAEALAETHKKSASQLTTQETMLARLNLIMKQTSSTQGDFSQTSNQLANSQRIAAAKTEELQAQIGQKLIPVVLLVTKAKLALVQVIGDKLVPLVTTLTQWFEKHTGVAKVAAAIIGGLLVVAFTAWAVSAGAAAVATIAATWPVLLIIGAIAALAAGVYYAYTHWKSFRDIVDAVGAYVRDYLWPILKVVGEFIGHVFVAYIKAMLPVWKEILEVLGKVAVFVGKVLVANFLNAAEFIVKAAAMAFGWVPGLGPKLQAAAANFGTFRDKVNDALNGIHDKTVTVNTRITGPAGSLISTGSGSFNVVNSHIRGYASGGVVGAAGGGPRSNLTLVGENGPELVDLAPGSTVHSNPDSRSMLSGEGATVKFEHHFIFSEGSFGRVFGTYFNQAQRSGEVTILSKAIV